MSNNIFYKALATVSTVGIVVIAGIQVATALKKGNNAEDQLAKTMIEIKKARRESLDEVKSIRSDVLKELNTLRTNSLKELKADKSNALGEVKSAKADALKAISKISGTSDESVWLVLVGVGASIGGGIGIEKIEMESMGQCELQGALWTSSKRLSENARARNVRYECITGK